MAGGEVVGCRLRQHQSYAIVARWVGCYATHVVTPKLSIISLVIVTPGRDEPTRHNIRASLLQYYRFQS